MAGMFTLPGRQQAFRGLIATILAELERGKTLKEIEEERQRKAEQETYERGVEGQRLGLEGRRVGALEATGVETGRANLARELGAKNALAQALGIEEDQAAAMVKAATTGHERDLEIQGLPLRGPAPVTIGEGGFAGLPAGDTDPRLLEARIREYLHGEVSGDVEAGIEGRAEEGVLDRAARAIQAAADRESRERISGGGGIPYGPVESRTDQKTLNTYWGESEWRDKPGKAKVAKAAYLRLIKAGIDPGLPFPTGSGPPVEPGPGLFERIGNWYRARRTMPLTEKQKAGVADLQAQGKSKAEIRKQFREFYGYEMP